jgi:hypothetical protein
MKAEAKAKAKAKAKGKAEANNDKISFLRHSATSNY